MRITHDYFDYGNDCVYVSKGANVDVITLENNAFNYEVSANSDGPIFGSYISFGGGNFSNSFSLGMKPGKTYTASVDIEIVQLYKAPYAADIPKIAVDVFMNGKELNDFCNSESAPNTIYGKFHINCSFTIPEEASGARIRLHLGAMENKGRVIFSNCQDVTIDNEIVL